jgi:hypothetical protein
LGMGDRSDARQHQPEGNDKRRLLHLFLLNGCGEINDVQDQHA